MKFKKPTDGAIKAELQMTSMIDIVFLLLIFFITTFKIAAQEGDFNIKMPTAGEGTPSDDSMLPIKLRLTADEQGNIADISINDRAFGKNFANVRAQIVQLVGSDVAPGSAEGPEVEIDLDYNLKYVYVIEAITSITGYKKGSDVIRLVDKIKFAPPRKP